MENFLSGRTGALLAGSSGGSDRFRLTRGGLLFAGSTFDAGGGWKSTERWPPLLGSG